MYNNGNEIKHTRNKMVCTSFDRLTTEPVWNIIVKVPQIALVVRGVSHYNTNYLVMLTTRSV